MRAYACLAALAAMKVAAHPLCFIDDKPTDYDQVLTYCDNSIAMSGACCTDEEEAQVEANYNAAFAEGVVPSSECAALYKEVVCGVCHSYSAHLYEYLPGGMLDGLTMKGDFCDSLVEACATYIDFPTYDGESYCDHHTGGGDDFFWSYPYEEPEIFEPGLNELFPDLGGGEQPDDTVSVRQTPDGSQWWLVGLAGEIYAVDSDDMASSSLVIDVSGSVTGGTFYVDYEEGLLDVAFGPMFSESGYPNYFYVSYTVDLNDGEVQRNRLARFTYIPGDAAGTKASEEVLLTTVPKSNSIHSAGWLGFKPSVYGNASPQDLYWTTGDGGPQTDPENHSQDTQTMLGAMMRITVPSDGSGYTIPSGNYGGGALDEICAIGFRNPWRCSFDRENDNLYCGDVGHTFVEEIDLVECGNNYGWSRFEGTRCQEAVENNEFNPPCDGVSRSGFTFPLYEYCHPDYSSVGDDEFTAGNDICGDRFILGNAVIGGYVYRGNFFSDLLNGAYIFGDSTMSNIYYLVEEGDGWSLGTIISDASVQIISFAEDINGEIMLLDLQHNIYYMPCGDLCATTCLDQTEDQPTYESLGCFADDVGDRALPIQSDICGEGETAMSPSICASYCETQGATFFGVQFSYECFCGLSTADYDKHGSLPDSDCEYLCDANPDQFCGGFGAMEVFTIEAPAETEAPATSPLVAQPIEPVAPSPTTPTTPTPSDASFLGCFADADDRVFSVSTASASMTSATCAAICSDYAYYATQFGEECWCGNNDAYDTNGVAVCDMECAGDASDICGGFFAMSVYSTGSEPLETPAPVDVVEPTDPTYLGCFVDSQTERVFPVSTDSGSMTAAFCADFCADYAYYGTQFGGECWCGNNSGYDTLGESTDCSIACSGDADEICGGFNAMSVYSTGSDPVETPTPVDAIETPAPVDVVEPTDPTFLGCYGDSQTARVFSVTTDSESMTSAFCASFCADYAYYGTQYGAECWCGNSGFDTYGESTDCSIACSGDANETCGGFNAMSIYANEDVDPVEEPVVEPVEEPTTGGGYTNLGCWSDPQDSRMMVEIEFSTSMTTAMCEELCDGSTYYGTQFAYECWCGDADTDYESDGPATCDAECGGDPADTCGGTDAMTVYGPA
ncbi:unnamed protein product [Ectocarpus sp. 12 AP-2014]